MELLLDPVLVETEWVALVCDPVLAVVCVKLRAESVPVRELLREVAVVLPREGLVPGSLLVLARVFLELVPDCTLVPVPLVLELVDTIRGRSAESELDCDCVPDRVLGVAVWVEVLDLLSAEELVRTEDVPGTELVLLFVVLEVLADPVLVVVRAVVDEACDFVLDSLRVVLEPVPGSVLDLVCDVPVRVEPDSDFVLLVLELVLELVTDSVLVPVREEVLSLPVLEPLLVDAVWTELLTDPVLVPLWVERVPEDLELVPVSILVTVRLELLRVPELVPVLDEPV